MKVIVKRQDRKDSEPYWQTFLYEKKERATVAAILDELNYRDDLTDENGAACRRILWECSCMQKMCGACAMRVNHEPVLACSTFVEPSKTKELILEPLTKFPVLVDLCVDRSCINEYMKEAELYIGQQAEHLAKEHDYRYTTAKCLKCGLCLEVCPNYIGTPNCVRAEGSSFYGAVFANESYYTHSGSANRKKEVKQAYQKHFAQGCSKSLACRDVCPMKIPTLSSIGYMNRQ